MSESVERSEWSQYSKAYLGQANTITCNQSHPAWCYNVSKIVGEYITFDDVVIVPGLAPVEPSNVDITGYASKSIMLPIPVLSSPMDTVTEHRLAILLARMGALGVIHRNMDSDSQAKEVQKVKKSNPSLWAELPRVDSPEALEDLLLRLEETDARAAIVYHGGMPVGIYIEKGADYAYWSGKAKAMITLLELVNPAPLTDEMGYLMVGAAISPFDLERAKKLESAGVDVLVTDVAHLHNEGAIRSLKKLVESVSVDVVAGNIGTREAALDILTRIEDVAGLRVGISSGSICSTGEVAGAAVPTLQAVLNVVSALKELGLHGKIPVIADGGIRNPGDAAKAIIAGASSVMTGRLFAGTEEAPSKKIRIGDKVYKTYRGMASRGAMEKRHASDRYSKPSKALEEGIEGLVPYTGSAMIKLMELATGLQAALGYAGAGNIREAWEKGRLAKITPIGSMEIKPHDILTK